MRIETATIPAGPWPVRWFHRFCERLTALLPFGLSRMVAPTFVGYLLLSACTFGLDLVLLTALHGGLGLPVPVAVTVAYVSAFATSFLLNRTLNFVSHAAVGPQLAVYVLVVVINYVLFILGVTSGLAALGLDYRLARIAAGLGEGLYLYVSMRRLVFRR
ncbi:GtrA family protein [Nocardia yamanashiensis]|uniref:GtrA family protein n=1 Tax=Nocardia yamanashiensis TaxID=209247 RepID=UPI001E3300CC|nr:GtrA family protein [Nocardia yamanashiensis]UGT42346.1 GtrA family protein [Nocardia yamanashiensis]